MNISTLAHQMENTGCQLNYTEKNGLNMSRCVIAISIIRATLIIIINIGFSCSSVGGTLNVLWKSFEKVSVPESPQKVFVNYWLSSMLQGYFWERKVKKLNKT